MDASTLLGIAITAVALGGALFGLAYVGARLFSRDRPPAAEYSPALVASLKGSSDAVVVARQGGQVIYTNDQARQLFRLDGDLPNLSRMARLAQPQDAFFELFAAEGHTELTVADRPLEATSVRIPGETAQFVVVLREAGQLAGLRADDRSSRAVAALGEIGRTVFASLDIEATANSILQIIGRIVPYDLAEINVWDAEAQALRPLARSGEQVFVLALDRKAQTYSLDDGYTGWVARNRQPLIIADIRRRPDLQPKVGLADFPFHSVVGVPMLYGADRDLIGTFELASFEIDAYSQQDVSLLETVAEQAAVAVHNAQLYVQQEARIAELSGLAQLAQTASALAEPRELFSSIVDRIAKLMNVQFCGFLLYDEAQHALVGQPPFRGMPEPVLDLYRIPASADTAAGRFWRDLDHWYSNDVEGDPVIGELGLRDLTSTVGMGTTLMVPLIAGGSRLGIVQVANKLNNTPFGDHDVRLLRIFAGQTAVLIDNARLVREADERVRRAEVLRQVSEIAGSGRSLEAIYREVMTRTATMVGADLGFVRLLDDDTGQLVPQRGSEFSQGAVQADVGRLPADDPGFKDTVTATRTPAHTGQAARDPHLAGAYLSLLGRHQLESAIVAPLIVQDRGIGEFGLAARRARAFSPSDVELVATIAAQVASAVERSRLGSATDQTLRHRVDQLTALTRVGRELNQTLDLEHILRSVYAEAARTTGADCGSIVLFDLGSAAPAARLRLGAHTSELDLDPLETEVALSGNSYLIRDLMAPEALAAVGLPEDASGEPGAGQSGRPRAGHTGIRSLVIVPIMHQGATVGILELHSHQTDGFDRAMLDFSQALASQAAVAVGNAQRFEEQLQRGELLRHRADQLSQLLQISRAVRSDRPLAENLEAIAFGVQEAVGYNVVLISVLDSATNLLHRTAAAGVPLATFEVLKQHPEDWSVYRAALRPEFQISQSYYVPHDRTTPELADLAAVVTPRSTGAVQAGEWHHDDFLLVPLVGSGGQPLGLMSVDDPRDGRVPDRLTAEAIEIFANQAALAIENARLFQAAESRAAELSHSLAELQKSYRDLDAVSRALSRKELELGSLIEQTEYRAKRLLALHRIASATAEARDEVALLQRVAEATVAEVGVEICLIALARRGSMQIVAQAGVTEPAIAGDQLTSHNPLSEIIELRSPLLATDLHGWGDSQLIQALGLRSFVGVPIFITGQLAGGVLVGSQQEPSPFSKEDVDLFTILAGQIGVGLENIRLYTDQAAIAAESRELQNFSESVIESLQQGLIVLDARGIVLRINGWMRQVFGWTDAFIGQNLFEIRPLYRDLGLADAIQRVIDEGQPTEQLVVRDVAPDGPLLIGSFYGSPLRREGRVSGVVLLVEDVTAQTQLEADVRERAVQLGALTEVSRVISSALRQDEVITLVLEQLGRVIPYASATLWLRQDNFLRVVGARGFDNDQEQLGLLVQVEDSRLFGEMSETQQAIAVPDVRQDERFPAGIVSRTRSWLGVPLISKGLALGLLALDKEEAGFYTAHHAELAMAFANQAAVALDNARLFEQSIQRTLELNDRSQRLALLNRVSAALSTTLDIERILEIGVLETSQALEAGRVGAIIYDEAAGVGRVLSEHPPPPATDRGATVPISHNPLVERLRQTSAPVVVDDVPHSDLIPESLRQASLFRGVKSMLIAPLIIGGRLLGTLHIDQGERAHLQSGEIELAQTIANQTAIAIQNALLYDETQLRLNELRAIYEMSRVITATIDLNEMFALLPEQIGRVLDTRNLYLALHDAQRNQLTFPIYYQDGKPLEVPPRPPGGLAGRVIDSRQPLLLAGDLEPEPRPAASEHIGAAEARSYLGVPLLSGEQVVGVIAVQDIERENAFTAAHERILSTVAAQIAVAIENSRLYVETRQRSAELATLFDFGVSISQVLDQPRLVDITFEYVQRLLGVDSIRLVMLNDAHDMTAEILERGRRQDAARLQPSSDGLSEQVLATRQPLLVGDVQRDGTAVPAAAPVGGQALRGWLGVPLLVRGTAIGVLSVQSGAPDYFGEAHLRLLGQVSNQLAIALDNARLFAAAQDYAASLEQRVADRTMALEKERDRVETLLRITNELSASLDLDRVLTRALGLVNEVIGGSQGGLLLLDAQSEQLIYRAALGINFQLPPGGQPAHFRRGEGLAGWVIKNRQPVIVPDLQDDERWIQRPQSEHLRSAICVPLLSSEDALGAMVFFSNKVDHFNDDQLRLVSAAANQVTSAINNAELYRLIRDQAERLGSMLRSNQVESSKNRAILESIADGILVADADGQIILFNAAAERILKLDRDEVVDRAVSDFMGLYGRRAKVLADAIERWTADPSSYQADNILAERLELEDKRIVSVLLTPVTSTDEYLGSVSIFRDITREVEVDRLKTEFVTTVSHELRTPITPIKGYADLLLLGAVGPLTPDQHSAVALIESNANRLRVLVDDLLDISKIESGRADLHLGPVSMAEVISEVVTHLRGRINAQGRYLTILQDLPPDLPLVLADRQRITQVMTNIADNAFSYTEEGGTITLAARAEGDAVQVSVTDTGIGLSPEEQARVFERFYRGENPMVMASAGTGLGLSIVQRLVDMHGGHIWVESKGVGHGSTFHVRLKVAVGVPEPAS